MSPKTDVRLLTHIETLNEWMGPKVHFVLISFQNLPSKSIEPAKDVHLGLFTAGLDATLATLHQVGRDLAACAVLQERVARLLQFGNGRFHQGFGDIEH